MGKVACELNSEGWMGFGCPEMAEGIPGQGNSLSKGTEAGVGGAYTRTGKVQFGQMGGCKLAPVDHIRALRRVLSGPPRTGLQGVLEKGAVHLQSQKVNNEAGGGGGRALES